MQTHQALNDISEGLQSLHLDPPDCLPFNPSGERHWLRATFNDVPRYLFRVFTPKSRGATDTIWTRSMDARGGNPNAGLDIFDRDDKREVADMLNRHLRWRKGVDDNLVSWTSSLLFALVYIFHLHANERDRSAFEDICLCVVDTTLFPPGVFLQDLDLIRAFCAFDKQLANFENLRLGGLYYFGEYLSQGALKIEHKCQIVSAQAMIDQGLYDLQPKFRDFAMWPKAPQPPWAKPVLKLREEFEKEPRDTLEVSLEEHLAAKNIADLFGGLWALPVAANLFALRPRRSWDERILATVRAPRFTDDAREDCSAGRTKIVAPSTLPEVQQYAELMRQVYQDFLLAQMKVCTSEAASELRRAIVLACRLGINDRTSDANALASTNPQYTTLQRQLDTITSFTQVIQKQLTSLRAATDVTDLTTG